MQIVIDIPEEIYENFQNAKCIGESKYKDYLVGIYFGIKKGIVLPKNHGRLIDADKIGLTNFEIFMCDGDYKEALKMILEKINNAPTVIAAEVKADE